jgi:hypothetical protein
MSIRNKPNYGIYTFNLTAQGFQDLPLIGTRVIFLQALTGATFGNVAGQSIVTGGTVAPGAIINVSVGDALGDPVPLQLNGKVNVEDAFSKLRISWGAQPGVTALVLVDDDRGGAGIFADSPSPILGGVVSLTGVAGSVATENVGTAGMGGQLNVSDEVPVGLELINNSTLAANSALQLVAPGANAGGTRVRTFELASATGGATALVTGIASPATLGSGINLLVSLNAVPAILPKPLFIRAPWGLWTFNTVVNGQAWGTWDP